MYGTNFLFGDQPPGKNCLDKLSDKANWPPPPIFGQSVFDNELLCQPQVGFAGRPGHFLEPTVVRLGWIEGKLFYRWISSGRGRRLFPQTNKTDEQSRLP